MANIIGNRYNKNNYFTIAFYNLENLFDTSNDPNTLDDDFLPNSERRWTRKRYKKKLRKLGYTISKIGAKSSKKLPVIVGLAEVENSIVVKDLIQTKFLKNENYDIVHYDSKDERGIDTALIYNKDYFEVHDSKIYSIQLMDEKGEADHTRDILCVKGALNEELIYLLVNHWPSRRSGMQDSDIKRMKASNKAKEVIEEIRSNDPKAKIIIMGDFNDDPSCKSIKNLVISNGLFNPMEALLNYSRGSLSYRFRWNLFDQIIFTTNFFKYERGKHSFSKANIFDDQFLKQFKGKFKGNPFRTFVGIKYKGGYSDHFPVFLLLKKSEDS
jgi:predicted extracellular nuclease